MVFPQSSRRAAVENKPRFEAPCLWPSAMAAYEASRHPAATNLGARHPMSVVRVSSSGMRFASRTNPQMSSGTSRQDCTIRPSRKQSPPVYLQPIELHKENR
jgi:hypothetical protein